MTGFDAAWIQAARFERDRRADRYPRLVAQRKLTEEAATLDYQAWVCIAQWMEAGKCALIGGWGGASDPPATVLSWALLESSAAKALEGIEAKLQRDGAAAPADKLAQLQQRRDAVFCIHALLVRQRDIATMTDRLVADRRQVKAAA